MIRSLVGILHQTLAQSWAQRCIDPAGLAHHETIRAVVPSPAVEPLPALLEAEGGRAPAVELGEMLGHGGMGVVYAATQTVMRRTVAVKVLPAEGAGPTDAQQLLREGRVTGLLEHPNVVPVHSMGRDTKGRPAIVMKRIDGTPWSRVIGELSASERLGAAFLREHLGILQQVARALHFAHSAGIIHRDVKPDNVMLGSFGEVYVVDWGIAVSTSDRHVAGVPRASSVRHIEGTPVYMAPEMAAGAGELLGVTSDVYLLGATLHEVLTGKPPHDADDIRDVLEHAFTSPTPSYPPEVPAELATILQRAMARMPEDRFESAHELVEAVDAFLLHWSSLELCLEGEHRTTELVTIASTAEEDEVERLFHEARFAFDQALRSWTLNERAQKGRRRLLERMIRFELQRGAVRAAQSLLRQHDTPPANLETRVVKAVEHLVALERDDDPAFGLKERSRRVYLGVASWLTTCLLAGYLSRSGIFVIEHRHLALYGVSFLLGSFASVYVARDKLLANLKNRTVTLTSVLVFAVGCVAWPMLGAFGLDMPQTTMVMAVVNGAFWVVLVLHFGRSWLAVPLSHAAVPIAAWLFPRYHFELFGVFTSVGMLVAAHRMQNDAMRAAAAPSSRTES